jgi:hypothetical protein
VPRRASGSPRRGAAATDAAAPGWGGAVRWAERKVDYTNTQQQRSFEAGLSCAIEIQGACRSAGSFNASPRVALSSHQRSSTARHSGHVSKHHPQTVHGDRDDAAPPSLCRPAFDVAALAGLRGIHSRHAPAYRRRVGVPALGGRRACRHPRHDNPYSAAARAAWCAVAPATAPAKRQAARS